MGYGVESSWVFFQMLRHGPGAGVNVIASSQQDFFESGVVENFPPTLSPCTSSGFLYCFSSSIVFIIMFLLVYNHL